MKEQIILITFALMAVILAVNTLRSLVVTGEALGTPPINRGLYAAGKAASILIWGAFIAHLLGWKMSFFEIPYAVEVAGFVMFLIGALLVITSFLVQGRNIRMGTSESNELKTSGIYHVSRNPMYIGFNVIDLAALIYTLNPFICMLLALAVYTHHLIVKSEEIFLKNKFGEAWDAYSAKVRRYI